MVEQSFIVKMPNMEVRKVEEVPFEINNKSYKRILVHFDDKDLNRLVFEDKLNKNPEDYEKIYERGVVGTLELVITTEKVVRKGANFTTDKTTYSIRSFAANEPKAKAR